MARQGGQIHEKLHFETDGELVKKKRKKATRKNCVMGGILALVLAGAVAGLLAFFVTASSDDGDDIPLPVTTSTTRASVTEADLVKLDCYPEAGSPQEQLTRHKCEARGCIYEPSEYDGVPDCFVDVNSTGFELVSQPLVLMASTTEYILRPKNSIGMFGQQFENVSFKVERLSDYMLHFSVSIR